MKRIIFKLTVFSALILFSAGISGAAHDLFKAMDSDNNKIVTREEFATDMKKDTFDSLDRNKDGILTAGEWETADYFTEADKKQEVFRHVDRDADRRISFPEFTNYAEKYSNMEEAFMIMDKNRDGSLSVDEVTVRPLFRLITVRY